MNNYSLIEFKLRRFIYLGEKTAIYVPLIHQKLFWEHKNKQDFQITGIKLIEGIITKNKIEDINSIVSIISKIAKEKNFQDCKYLIYLLAVCAKLNLNNCQQMVIDANAMVVTICTDGLKLMMFYKFCSIVTEILYEKGNIPTGSSGLGKGTRLAIQKWYLNKDAHETIKLIMKRKTYGGVDHKQIMNTIHIHSDDPSHNIYITYILYGLKRMKKIFESKILINDNDCEEEKLSKIQQRCVYDYIIKVHRIHNSTNDKLSNDLKWNSVGKDYEIVVSKMLTSPKVLTAYVKQLPLRTLLNNTYTFVQHNFFNNLMGDESCMEYILRFNNLKAVKEAEIHPIESYLEYLRYINSRPIIREINDKKNDTKKCNNEDSSSNLQLSKSINEDELSVYCMQLPKYSVQLEEFLSIDLMKKTLDNLNPISGRLFIAYDGREYIKSVKCHYMHLKFLKVIEAITLIIQSLVYPNQINANIKPTVCALFNENKFKMINVGYEKVLKISTLENHLFKQRLIDQKCTTPVRNIKPIRTLNWSKKRNLMYDVFLFLGTNKMDLKKIREAKAEYEAYFSNSKIKIIICCLNGNHTERIALSRDGLLFITGFDKNVGKIIESFINNKF